MTNSEKALEYAAEKFKVNPESKKWNITTTYMSACEWKDRQFKEYLEKKKADIEQGILHSNPLIDGDRWYGRGDIINEIINELFGEG